MLKEESGSALLKYYIKSTDEKLSRMEKKIDKLSNFQWRVIGFATGTFFIAQLISFSMKILNS